MTYRTLVNATTLNENINNPNWIIIDCRFSLADSEAGCYAYRHDHLPNARYAHLNDDLSSFITSYTGRHPLPDFNLLAKKLGLGESPITVRWFVMMIATAALQGAYGGYYVAWVMIM